MNNDLRPGQVIRFLCNFRLNSRLTQGEILHLLSPAKVGATQHGKLYVVCYGDGLVRYVRPEDVIEVVPPK